MDVFIRSMDPDLWARLKAAAALERKPLRVLLQQIISDYLARREHRP